MRITLARNTKSEIVNLAMHKACPAPFFVSHGSKRTGFIGASVGNPWGVESWRSPLASISLQLDKMGRSLSRAPAARDNPYGFRGRNSAIDLMQIDALFL